MLRAIYFAFIIFSDFGRRDLLINLASVYGLPLDEKFEQAALSVCLPETHSKIRTRNKFFACGSISCLEIGLHRMSLSSNICVATLYHYSAFVAHRDHWLR